MTLCVQVISSSMRHNYRGNTHAWLRAFKELKEGGRDRGNSTSFPFYLLLSLGWFLPDTVWMLNALVSWGVIGWGLRGRRNRGIRISIVKTGCCSPSSGTVPLNQLWTSETIGIDFYVPGHLQKPSLTQGMGHSPDICVDAVVIIVFHALLHSKFSNFISN